MESIELGILTAGLIVALANLIFALLRTYYAKFTKKTYSGSVEYWNSWGKRKFDVAAEVLKEMGISSAKDLKKLITNIEKRKERKR